MESEADRAASGYGACLLSSAEILLLSCELAHALKGYFKMFSFPLLDAL